MGAVWRESVGESGRQGLSGGAGAERRDSVRSAGFVDAEGAGEADDGEESAGGAARRFRGLRRSGMQQAGRSAVLLAEQERIARIARLKAAGTVAPRARGGGRRRRLHQHPDFAQEACGGSCVSARAVVARNHAHGAAHEPHHAPARYASPFSSGAHGARPVAQSPAARPAHARQPRLPLQAAAQQQQAPLGACKSRGPRAADSAQRGEERPGQAALVPVVPHAPGALGSQQQRAPARAAAGGAAPRGGRCLQTPRRGPRRVRRGARQALGRARPRRLVDPGAAHGTGPRRR